MDVAEVQKLAALARLKLTEDEAAEIAPQLSGILGFVEQLASVDTEDVEPMTSALAVGNRLRDDRRVTGLDRDAALANAPKRGDDCFLVPPVL